MALSRQGTHRSHQLSGTDAEADLLDLAVEMPDREIPRTGISREAAYELISSELLVDGAARLNLATFVTTWMPPIAGRSHGRDGGEEHDR